MCNTGAIIGAMKLNTFPWIPTSPAIAFDRFAVPIYTRDIIIEPQVILPNRRNAIDNIVENLPMMFIGNIGAIGSKNACM